MCKTVFDPVEVILLTKLFSVFTNTGDKNLFWLKFDSKNVEV